MLAEQKDLVELIKHHDDYSEMHRLGWWASKLAHRELQSYLLEKEMGDILNSADKYQDIFGSLESTTEYLVRPRSFYNFELLRESLWKLFYNENSKKELAQTEFDKNNTFNVDNKLDYLFRLAKSLNILDSSLIYPDPTMSPKKIWNDIEKPCVAQEFNFEKKGMTVPQAVKFAQKFHSSSSSPHGRLGLTIGDFRVPHIGHAGFLLGSKAALGKNGVLIVAIPTRKVIEQTTDKDFILHDDDRMDFIAALATVDYVVALEPDLKRYSPVNDFYRRFYSLIKPNVFTIGDEGHFLYEECVWRSQNLGGLLLFPDWEPQTSATEIITQIRSGEQLPHIWD